MRHQLQSILKMQCTSLKYVFFTLSNDRNPVL